MFNVRGYKRIATILIASMMLIIVGVASAAAPANIITYQGRVLNTNGVPVSDSTLDMKFMLYDALTGGTCVWSNDSVDCQSNTPASVVAKTITLTSGLYTENLGDTGDSYAAIGDSIFGDNTNVFLEVVIEGETLTPRKRLSAAPYALNAQRLDGIDSTGFLAATGDTGTGDYDLTGAELAGASPLVFEGASDDGNTTTFAITDPSGANTITFQNGTGTLAFTSDITGGEWEQASSRVFEDDYPVVIGANGALTYTTESVGDLRVSDELEVIADAFFATDVVIGASTSATETIEHTSFTLGGDDLFVAGDAGVEGVIYTDGGLTVGNGTTYGNGTITSSGTTDLLLTIAGGDLTFGQATVIGGGSNVLSINSSDWDVSTTGDLTGIGGITMNGSFSQTGSGTFSTGTGQVDLNGDTHIGGDVDIDGTQLAGNGSLNLTAAGTLGVQSGNGSGLTLSAHDGVDSAETVVINGYNFSVDASGNLDASGTIGSGTTMTAGTDLTVTSGARIGTGSTPSAFTALADDSLFVEGLIEVDGAARFDGNLDATSGLDVTTANLTVGGANFSVAPATGNLITAGDIAVNGGDITTTATTWNFDVGNTGSMLFRDGTNTLFTIADNGTTGNAISSGDLTAGADLTVTSGSRIGIGSTPDAFTALADDSMFIEGQLEVDGAARFDGTITVSDLVCTDCLDFDSFADTLTLDAATSIATAGYQLSTSGTGALNFGSTGQVTFGGNVNATNGLDVTIADLTVGGANFSVAQATGNITTSGDVAVNGGDVTSTGNLNVFQNASSSLYLGVASGESVTVGNGSTNQVFITTDSGTPYQDIYLAGGVTVNDETLFSLGQGENLWVQNLAATSSTPLFQLDYTTDTLNVGTAAAQQINFTLTDYVDDGAADPRTAFDVTVTNNASDAGTDDDIYGVRVNEISGAQSDGNEYAFYQGGTAWDYGLYTEDLIYHKNTGTGIGVTIDQDGNGRGLFIDSESTSQAVAMIDGSATTTGQLLSILGGDFTDDSGLALSIDVTETTETADIVNIQTDYGSPSNNVFRIEADGEVFSDIGFTAGAFSTNYMDGEIQTTSNLLLDIDGGNLTFDQGTTIGDNSQQLTIDSNGTLTVNDTKISGNGVLTLASAAGGALILDSSSGIVSTNTGDDFSVGLAASLASAFSVDESANAVRIGDATGTSASLSMYASNGETGTITYNTDDYYDMDGGGLKVGYFKSLTDVYGISGATVIDAGASPSGGVSSATSHYGGYFQLNTESYPDGGAYNARGLSGVTIYSNNSYTGPTDISGVYGLGRSTANAQTAPDVAGVRGVVDSEGSSGLIANAFGVQGTVDAGAGNITNGFGGFFQNISDGTNRYGVTGTASGGSNNYSGYFYGSPLFVDNDASPNTPGIATGTGDLYVADAIEADGNLDVAGSITAASISCTDCLDFAQFQDAMLLDASTSITSDGSETFTIANNSTGNTIINLQSTGDFIVQDSGAPAFVVSDGGAVSLTATSSTNHSILTDSNTALAFDSNTDATDVDITTATDEDLIIKPNGAGDTIFSLDAGTQVEMTVGEALTSGNILTLSNSGYATATAGVDGIDLTYNAGDASVNAIHIVPGVAGTGTDTAFRALNIGAAGMTFSNTTGTDTAYGIDLGALTETGAGAITSYGMRLGSGWDNQLYFADTTTSIAIEDTGSISFIDSSSSANPLMILQDKGAYGALIVNEVAAASAADLTLLAGGTSASVGQDVIVTAGTGDGVGNVGGTVQITGGQGAPQTTGSDGGKISIRGGQPTGTGGIARKGGGVDIIGQDGLAAGGGGSGGAVSVVAGDAQGTGANSGGNISLTAGSKTGAGFEGNVSVISGGMIPALGLNGGDVGLSADDEIRLYADNTITMQRTSGASISITGVIDLEGGDVTVDLATSGQTHAVCHTDGVNNDTVLEDCIGSVTADYAEQYPVEEGVEYGDIVVPGTEEVTTMNGDVLVQMVKSSEPYTGPIVGIVSNNYGDFTSAGYNIEEEDNPMPVALVGRVPVKVTNENGSIEVGDYLTTSSTPGHAMKASKVGRVIGMALTNFDDISGTVMVQVNNSWYMGDVIGTDGESTLVTDNVIISPVGDATASEETFDSYGLALRGSAWNGSEAEVVDMMMQNVVEDVDNYRLSITDATDNEVAYITNEGTMRIANHMVVGGNIYPSDRGTPQTDKYIYYDGSAGPAGDFMRTNAKGWSTGSYDFAEMFPSTQELEPGDIVMFSGNGEYVQRTNGKNPNALAGIVSTRPGFLAGENVEGAYPIALAGRVPTRVNLENGAVNVGDPLTSSSIPGVAMKAKRAGAVIGYALEPYTGSENDNLILTYVNVSYWGGSGALPAPGTNNAASGFAQGQTTNYVALNMSGNISMNSHSIFSIGNLTGMGDLWSVDSIGTIKTESVVKNVITSHLNEKVETIAVTSPEAVITLSGTATLVNGEAHVRFENVAPQYNDVISAIAPIRVIATPNGPTSLYVSEKDQNHFIVKSFGGASDVEFDWMVTAYRKGYEPEEPQTIVEEPQPDPALEEPEPIEEVVEEEETTEEPIQEQTPQEEPEEAEAQEEVTTEPEPVAEEELATPESPELTNVDSTPTDDGGETAEEPSEM